MRSGPLLPSPPRLFLSGLTLALAVTTGACGSKSSGSASGSEASGSASASAKARATVTEPAEEPRPTSPFDLPGDPFSGEPKDPGESAEIPRVKGYFVTAPKGFRIEKDAANGQLTLIPASGTAKVILAAEIFEATLDQRAAKLLQESMTQEATWQTEKGTSVGAGWLAGAYARGVGYQGFPGGRREPHKLLRVRIPTDVRDGTGTLVIQALAVWNGADVETEVQIVEAVKGIHRK